MSTSDPDKDNPAHPRRGGCELSHRERAGLRVLENPAHGKLCVLLLTASVKFSNYCKTTLGKFTREIYISLQTIVYMYISKLVIKNFKHKFDVFCKI